MKGPGHWNYQDIGDAYTVLNRAAGHVHSRGGDVEPAYPNGTARDRLCRPVDESESRLEAATSSATVKISATSRYQCMNNFRDLHHVSDSHFFVNLLLYSEQDINTSTAILKPAKAKRCTAKASILDSEEAAPEAAADLQTTRELSFRHGFTASRIQHSELF